MTTFKYSEYSNQELAALLAKTVALEQKTIAEILEILVVVAARKLYLERGYASLFAYMTEELKYSASSAQRRIEAARLLREIPEMHDQFKSGALNLTQVSMLAHGLRQKPVDTIAKKALLQKIENRGLQETQKILCHELALPLIHTERQKVQRDNSQRLEITFTAEQMAYLQRLKEVLSHTHAGENWAEHFMYAVKFTLKRRDPMWEIPPEPIVTAGSVPEEMLTVRHGKLVG